MGFLNLFAKAAPAALLQLPMGSFTMDRSGQVVVATLPSSFPRAMVQQIGSAVVDTFREAQVAQLPLAELVINYPSFKITAREMRGGAIIYLSPSSSASANRQHLSPL